MPILQQKFPLDCVDISTWAQYMCLNYLLLINYYCLNKMVPQWY